MMERCRSILNQEKLEAYIVGLMHCIRRDALIRELFSNDEIVEILHHGANIFMSKPILLEFDLPADGLVVIGDLHGNIYSLLRAFERHGLPPKTYYLFLGDYVDRGQQQLELILLLILLKIRWPGHMILLRGNHETVGFMKDDYVHMITHGEFFAKVCQNQLASTSNMYFFFNQMFDVMPVAAVISGHYLCCHGGVSQWMTCLENIRNIPRPTYAKKMSFLEACLLADILWADPNPMQDKAFAVSRRGCGYTFNKKGLKAVLEALKLKTLIRGHEMYLQGTTRNFDDDSCVTVHTAPSALILSSATLKLTCVGGINYFEQITEEIDSDASLSVVCRAITDQLTESFKSDTFKKQTRFDYCQWCLDPPSSFYHERVRLYAHRDLDVWVKQFANEWARKDEIYSDSDNLFRLDHTDYVYEERRIQRSVELFPVFYDIRFLGGGSAIQGGTFRVLVSNEERQFIGMIYPDSKYLDERVSFSKYDPSLLTEVVMERTDIHYGKQRRSRWFERTQTYWHRIWCWIMKCCGRSAEQLIAENDDFMW